MVHKSWWYRTSLGMGAGASRASTLSGLSVEQQQRHQERVNQHLCAERQAAFESQLGEVSRLIRAASLPRPTTLLDLDDNCLSEIAEHCTSMTDRMSLLCVCHDLRHSLSNMQLDMTPLPESGFFFGVPRPLQVVRWLQAQSSQQAFILRGIRLHLKLDAEYSGALPWTQQEDEALEPYLRAVDEDEATATMQPHPCIPRREPAEVGCRMHTLFELAALREALRLCGDFGLRDLTLQSGSRRTLAEHAHRELRSGWCPNRLTIWLPDRRHGAVSPHVAISLGNGVATGCEQLRMLCLQGLVLTDLGALATSCPHLKSLELNGCALMRRPPSEHEQAAASTDSDVEAEASVRAVTHEWTAAASAALRSAGRSSRAVLERQEYPPADLSGLDGLADRLEALTLRYLRHPVQLLAASQLAPYADRCSGLRTLIIEGHTVDSLGPIGELVALRTLELDLSVRVHDGVIGSAPDLAPLARLAELTRLRLCDDGGITVGTPLPSLAPIGACKCLESLELINLHTLDVEVNARIGGLGAEHGANGQDEGPSNCGIEELYARGCWPKLTLLSLRATPVRRLWRVAEAPNAGLLTHLDVSGVDSLPRMVRPGLLELTARMPKLRTLVAEYVLPHRWTPRWDAARDRLYFQYTVHAHSGSPGTHAALSLATHPNT